MKLFRNCTFSAVFLLMIFPMAAQELSLGEKLDRGSVLDICISDKDNTAALLETWDGDKFLCVWTPSGDLEATHPLTGNFFGLFSREDQWLSVLLPEEFSTSDLQKSGEVETGSFINALTGETLQKLPPSQLLSRAVDYGKELKDSDAVYHIDRNGRFLSVEYWLEKTNVKIDEKPYDSEFQIINLETGSVVFSRLFLAERDSFIPRGRFTPRITGSFSRDGKSVVLAGTEQVTGLYSLETGERDAVFLNILDEAFFLFLNDTYLLQYNHYSRKCKIYSSQGGLPKKTFRHGLRYPVVSGQYIISIFDDGYQIFQADGTDIREISFKYFKPMRSAFFIRQRVNGENLLFPRAFSDKIIEYRQLILPGE